MDCLLVAVIRRSLRSLSATVIVNEKNLPTSLTCDATKHAHTEREVSV